jgi:ABC-type branched-subunit amino acid transport system ATPase component/branched-subunit amino acid ABC-type transport system permease component
VAWVTFALLGLGIGAVYVGISLGVVVIYKGTGAINFAMAVVAAWGAFVCDELRTSGNLVLPIIGLPHEVNLGGPLPTATAILVGLLASVVIALVVHVAVVRPLTTAPNLAKVVASVGLMIYFQSAIALNFGSATRQPIAMLSEAPVQIGSIAIPIDRFILTAVVIALSVGVWAWFRWTRTGLAVMAVSENERAASLAGYSPHVLGAVTWVLGTVISTFVVILASPATSLDGDTYTLLIVPALAVALAGSLQSVPVILIAGLSLGAMQSCVTFASSQTWFPSWAQQGASEVLPFVMIVVVMFLRGNRIPQRGAVKTNPLPKVVIPELRLVPMGAFAAVGVLLVVLTSGSYRFGVITSLIGVVISLSLVLLTGMLGQISFAQAAFAGTAGFFLSKIGSGIPFPLSLIMSGFAAAGVGLVVGVPALRIRGAQLAVVTLAAAVAIEELVFDNTQITPLGGDLIPSPSVLGWNLGVRSGTDVARVQFGLLVLVIVVIVVIAVANLMRSATGRQFLAVRDNEKAGSSLGIRVASVKLTGFVTSAFIAGIGGSLIGYSRGQLSPSSFGVFAGISVLAFAYLGGITSLGGALLAGFFAPLGIGYVVLNQIVGSRIPAFSTYYTALGGVGLIVTAIVNPNGIAGDIREAVYRGVKKFSRRSAKVSPEAPADILDSQQNNSRAQPPKLARPAMKQLVISDLSVSFGGNRAVYGVSLTLEPGQVVGLIGPNGAGKTTLIDAVTGFVPSSGHVRCGDVDISKWSPDRRARVGVARTWQSIELFDELTVRDNCRVGTESATPMGFALDLIAPRRRVEEPAVTGALELLGLEAVAGLRPSELSPGQQKLLGVARALASGPMVILLDEPAAGLDTMESVAFGKCVRQIAELGIGVLLVEHDVDLVLSISDELCVLDAGRVLAVGAPAEVRLDPRVLDAYLGTDSKAGVP